MPYIELVGVLDDLGCTVIYRHRPLRKAELLFELGVHEKNWFAVLRRTLLNCLLEKIPRTLEFGAALKA
jgi:hypothetical protein